MKYLIAGLLASALSLLASCEDEERSVQPNLNEAKQALMKFAVMQERFYREHEAYSIDMTELDFESDPALSSTGTYTVDMEPNTRDDYYSGTATYNGADVDDQECQWFRIDGHGQKTSGPRDDCWTR